MKKYLPYLNILGAAACWGCIGLFNRFLMRAGMGAANIVVIRNFGGLVLLTLIFALRERSVFHVKAKHLPIFFGTGVVSMVFFTLCYFKCQELCSLAVSAILLYTAPAMVVLMSAAVFRERITRKKLLALALALLGCSFVTGVWSGDASVTAVGVLFGLGAGFLYALYSIFAPFGLQHYTPFTVVYWTFVFGGLGSLFLLDAGEMRTVFADGRIGPRRAGADRHFDGAAVSAVYERPCQGRERQGEHSGESGAGGRVVRGHSRLRRAGELDGIFRAGVHPRLRVCIEVKGYGEGKKKQDECFDRKRGRIFCRGGAFAARCCRGPHNGRDRCF